MSTYINSYTNWFSEPTSRSNSTSSTSPNPENLDKALLKIASAVARLHRSGPIFRDKSEAFWIFCAGSWTRENYDMEVEKAGKLQGNGNVEEDLKLALEEIWGAMSGLRGGDKEDLMDAIEDCGIW